MDTYSPPVDRLLSLGGDHAYESEHDYIGTCGLSVEHVPELIRMATDWELHWSDSDSTEVWAPTHAWRALGELRSVEAVEPILGLLNDLDRGDDEAYLEIMPRVIGRIGPAAIPILDAYLSDGSNRDYPRVSVADSLVQIARRHPESRDECVRALMDEAALPGRNDPTFNGFVICHLINLHAQEAAATIERAFQRGLVDESIVGGWDSVRAVLRGEPEVPTRSRGMTFPALGLAGPPQGLDGPMAYRKEARRARSKAKRRARRAQRAQRAGQRR